MAGYYRSLLILFIAATACIVAGCTADPYADKVSAEDKRVMRALVDISCKLGYEQLIVSDRPATPRQSGPRQAGGGNVQFGIDFDRRVAHEARWPRGQICPYVRVVADSAIGSVLAHDTKGWDRFIATFDGARSLMRISLPVYSPDGKRAIVYTTGSCPYTCGAGFYHELEETSSGWRITDSLVAWTT
jgi:hypothetical protein